MTQKVYKTFREIYADLYNEYIEDEIDLSISAETLSRNANIYAVKNTVKVWKAQYE